jgi:hypothetical protein
MKRRLANFLVLLASSALCLFLLEMAYRFYLFGWDMFSIEKVNSMHEIGVSGLLQASPYRDLIFELKPNQDTHFKLVPFVTNSPSRSWETPSRCRAVWPSKMPTTRLSKTI